MVQPSLVASCELVIPISALEDALGSGRALDLTGAARVIGRKPFGTHEIVEAGRQHTVSHIAIPVPWHGPQVGPRLLESVCFGKDDPGACTVEPTTRLGARRNFRRKVVVSRRRVRDRERHRDLLSVPDCRGEQDGARPDPAAVVGGSLGFVDPEKR